MKQHKVFNLAIVTIAGVMLIALSLLFVGNGAQAAPPAAPTPLANVVNQDSGRFLIFQTATALTADTNTTGRQIMEFDTLHVGVLIDHGTLNTTTVTVQWSNDNTNWDDGPAVVSNNAADAYEIVPLPIFGRYVRFKQDLSNSNSITITLNAVAK